MRAVKPISNKETFSSPELFARDASSEPHRLRLLSNPGTFSSPQPSAHCELL